ncbi:MAG: hypothetical protein JNL79_24620, partial [Myxococcales bacterium]|nr:hypothetical protein [Myxococcales bacterium]
MLELLDERGVPRIRTYAPVLVDAKGVERHGVLDVEGCAVDHDARPPWGRPVTRTGATECTLRIGWDETGLAHPILVDPVWTTTKGVMVDGRQRHAAVHIETKGTACVNGCVLVFGGFKSAGGAVVTTTELYDEGSGTFTAVPSPTKDGWAMAGLAPVAGGAKAMVFGGRVYPAGLPSAYTTLAYVYDPESSSTPWTAAPSLSEARSDFCVTWDAKSIWVSGGMNVVGPSNAVDVFDGTKWNSTAKLYKKRASHFCGHIVNKDGTHPFLVAGGMDDGYVDTDTVEAFVEDSPGTWTPKYWIGKLSQAKSEGGSVNVSPTVMLAIGGRLATKVERLAEYTSTSETMLGLRHSRPGVAPYRGGALVVGGSDAWGDRASLIDESGKTVETYPVVTPRVFAALTTMKSGAVLMTGGSTPTPPTGPALVLASAEVFDLGANGLACAKGSDCLSGFCVDGLCCDKGCTGQCEACNLPKTLGKCTTVDGSDAPTGYTKGQAVTGFGTTTRTLCASFDALCGFRCDGTTSTACSAAKTTVECTPGSCADGVETKPAFCNGTGECAASTKANCGDFACGPKGCVTKCAADTDCVKGRKCTLATGTCDPPKATCTNATTSQPVGGPAKDCTPYACDPATGACLG